jgi:hypothetical protein
MTHPKHTSSATTSLAVILLGSLFVVGGGYLAVEELKERDRSYRSEYRPERPSRGEGWPRGEGWLATLFSWEKERAPVRPLPSTSWGTDSLRRNSPAASLQSDTTAEEGEETPDPTGISPPSDAGKQTARTESERTATSNESPAPSDGGLSETERPLAVAGRSGGSKPSGDSEISGSSDFSGGSNLSGGSESGGFSDPKHTGPEHMGPEHTGLDPTGDIGDGIDVSSSLASAGQNRTKAVGADSKLGAIAREAAKVTRKGHQIANQIDRMYQSRSTSASRKFGTTNSSQAAAMLTKDREDPGSPPPIPVEDDLHWLFLAGSLWGMWRLWRE